MGLPVNHPLHREEVRSVWLEISKHALHFHDQKAPIESFILFLPCMEAIEKAIAAAEERGLREAVGICAARADELEESDQYGDHPRCLGANDCAKAIEERIASIKQADKEQPK